MEAVFDDIEKKVGYTFANRELLVEALTHSSKRNTRENGMRLDNERLEFIGDAMLDAIVGVLLYEKLPAATEGELTKLRAQIVCEDSLNRLGRSIELGEALIMGESEERSSGRSKPSVVADAVEAVIGAIYMDGGYSEAYRFVDRAFQVLISDALDGKLFRDYKTKLQELAHKHNLGIEYVTEESGPDHDKTFYVHLKVNGTDKGYGVGKSKKEAEQKAAENYLEKGIENVL